MTSRHWTTLIRSAVLILVTGIFCFSLPAHASKKVGLLIWVDDGEPDNVRHMQTIVNAMSKVDGTVEFRQLGLPPAANRIKNSVLESLRHVVHEEDKISTLVIGTHGTTIENGKTTSLKDFGFFSDAAIGVIGDFRDVLSFLGRNQHLDENLHLFLDACSTFCGTEQQIDDRVGSIYNLVKLHGVKTLSVWGARQVILRDNFRLGSILNTIRPTGPGVAQLLGLSVLSFIAMKTSVEIPYPFLSSVTHEISKALVMALSLAAAYLPVKMLIYQRDPKKRHGYLVEVKESGTEFSPVQVDHPTSYFGRTCSTIFAPASR